MKKSLKSITSNQSVRSIVVKYRSNPDKVVNDHIGNYFDMVDYSEKIFTNPNEALAFYTECTRPISTLDEIMDITTDIKQSMELVRVKKLKSIDLYLLKN